MRSVGLPGILLGLLLLASAAPAQGSPHTARFDDPEGDTTPVGRAPSADLLALGFTTRLGYLMVEMETGVGEGFAHLESYQINFTVNGIAAAFWGDGNGREVIGYYWDEWNGVTDATVTVVNGERRNLSWFAGVIGRVDASTPVELTQMSARVASGPWTPVGPRHIWRDTLVINETVTLLPPFRVQDRSVPGAGPALFVAGALVILMGARGRWGDQRS